MIKLSDSQISNIAENLECGMLSYINTQTGEIKTVFDIDNAYGEVGIWEQDLNEIEEKWINYIKVENIPSYESFKIMEQYVETLLSPEIKDELYHALDKNKPFQKFKDTLSYYPIIKEKWYAFKADKYREWVKDQLQIQTV